MSTPRSLGLDHFVRLNTSTWFREPTSPTSATTNGPDLILLLGWMGATPRHISKYAAGYEKLYPSARVLAITTSEYDATFRSSSSNLKALLPALEMLYTLPPNTKLLIHFFSNGGAFRACHIAREYQKQMGKPLPVTAMVLDSNPGKAVYATTLRAFAVGLPKNFFLRIFGLMILRVLFVGFILGHTLTGTDNMVDRIRKELNDKRLFDEKAPRMYIYSKGDDMVDWRFVEEHAAEAKKIGYRVDMEEFGESGHAAHMLLDAGRYWGTVQRLWAMVWRS